MEVATDTASTDTAADVMMDLDGTISASALAGGAAASTDTAAGVTDLQSDGTDTMEIATDTTAAPKKRHRKRSGKTGSERRKLKQQINR